MKIRSESFACKEDKRHGVIAGKRSGPKESIFFFCFLNMGEITERI